MPIRCVLFDFDGVIADTEERNADYLASALAHFGVRLTEKDRSALVGINDPSLLEALLKRAETPVTLEQLQAERTRHGNYYENGADLHTQPGLREFLSALRAQGIRTGVVSSTRSQLILTALDRLHLVSQFDVLVPPTIVWSSRILPQASVPERPPAVPCWAILAAPSVRTSLRQISPFLIFIFTDKFHLFRIFLRSDFMTKQTKPVQIGLVCFAFKLFCPVLETRHRRNGSTYFFSEGSMAFPDRSDLPARTMLTSEGSVSRSTHVVADPRTQRLRTLTPIECERLNGFPDDWTAGMPERLRYFTMGNALVVSLVKAMGKRISALAEDERRS